MSHFPLTRCPRVPFLHTYTHTTATTTVRPAGSWWGSVGALEDGGCSCAGAHSHHPVSHRKFLRKGSALPKRKEVNTSRHNSISRGGVCFYKAWSCMLNYYIPTARVSARSDFGTFVFIFFPSSVSHFLNFSLKIKMYGNKA